MSTVRYLSAIPSVMLDEEGISEDVENDRKGPVIGFPETDRPLIVLLSDYSTHH
ncbi:uncharacterized protein RCO7_15232 [Rhynchosporium graminicola]|uniref:Uncharacterized protein n=2 Tax=Rhynchosporium TaxID=38037 RepID=A0A1E1MB99_RHYSE|nr:uncharacterized protein RCO7_15232 [Rhynchosporium commune]CZT46382.1 uncharacterized protein RSE6_06802 [Rhynchosporium secalis]